MQRLLIWLGATTGYVHKSSVYTASEIYISSRNSHSTFLFCFLWATISHNYWHLFLILIYSSLLEQGPYTSINPGLNESVFAKAKFQLNLMEKKFIPETSYKAINRQVTIKHRPHHDKTREVSSFTDEVTF